MTLRDATIRTPADPADAAGTLEPLLSIGSVLWYIRLRWVFIATPLLFLAAERVLFPGYSRPPEIFYLLAALGLLNVGWWLAERSQRNRGSPSTALHLTHAQIAADLVILTALIRFTGGYESPLTIFYVFHVVFAALLLPPRGAFIEAVWAIALFGGLVAGEAFGLIKPYHPAIPSADAVVHQQGPAFAVAMVVAVAAGILGTHYLTGSIAARLRKRELQLETVNAHLRTSQEVIQQLQERRSRFMQTAAHRLKSPLATVQTLAGLIRDGIVAGAEIGETYSLIARCCADGIVHVTELLTLARVQDADPARHEQSQADVGRIVAAGCLAMQPGAVSRNVTLAWSVPTDPALHARVDPRDLEECLANVVDNAVKYTPAGGKVTVSVARTAPSPPSPAWIIIDVEDTGIGFDADLLTHFNRDGTPTFDAYRRGNNALAAGITGSGLGLAIVGAVVEQAGGRIEVQARSGGGTRFTLKFPATDRKPDLVESPATAGAAASGRRPSAIAKGTDTAPPSNGRQHAHG